MKFTPKGHVTLRAWAKNTDFRSSTISPDHGCRLSNKWNPFAKFNKNDGFYKKTSSSSNDPNCIEFIFEVDDSGIGIPKEKRAFVFENYVQVPESTSSEHEKGTGLGLGIVQSYVRLMGGEINILDKDRNENGTCFRFNIFLSQTVPPISIERDTLSCHKQLLDELHGASVLHFIQGVETRKVLQRWMEAFGAMVWGVDGLKAFHFALEKLHIYVHRHSHHDSISCIANEEDVGGSTQLKCAIEENFFLKRTRSMVSLNQVLIIIDMSYQPLKELISILENFANGTKKTLYKIVWLRGIETPQTELRRLEIKDVPCDLILEKPLHGSRIYKMLELLQEPKVASHGVISKSSDHTRLLAPFRFQEGVESSSILIDDRPLIGWNILIAEDNNILRLVASKIVSSLGANVKVVENGEVALNAVREALKGLDDHHEAIAGIAEGTSRSFLYDLILMDCQMPKMNGYVAAKQIRLEEKQYGIHIPIVALTADSANEKGDMSIEAGMDHHVMKPLSRELLLDVIHKLNIARNTRLIG